MCFQISTRKGALLQCVYLVILSWTFHSGNALDWHSCFNTTHGIRATMSSQKCQEQCLLTEICTGISFCRRTGICHMVYLPLETGSFVNNSCTGCVVVYRENISQDVHHSDDSTQFIGCDVNISGFNGCRIEGNMYHSGHTIHVQCDMVQYDCQNSTFVCDINGTWIFENCSMQITQKRDSSSCTEGWTSFGSSCYRLEKETLSWSDAQAKCAEHTNGHLVHISSIEENDQIKKKYESENLNGIGIWIGLNDLDVVGAHKWTDGTVLLPSDFADWGEGQDGAGGEQCIGLYRRQGYNWHDFTCTRNDLVSICEIDII